MILIKRALLFILLIACGSLLSWLYWQYQHQQEKEVFNQKLDMLSGKVELKLPQEQIKPPEVEKTEMIKPPEQDKKKLIRPTPKKATPVNLSVEELLALKQKADEKQKQIDELIIELDQNLANPEQKAQIQVRINELLEQYNELILPVALNAIAEKNAEADRG